MPAMVQQLDASSFFIHTHLSVSTFSALVLEVCRNRFRCHVQSVAELALSKLSNLALCQRSNTWIGISEVLSDSAGTNPLIRLCSISKQSAEMSNLVQSTRE
jgi:hypothetical protein